MLLFSLLYCFEFLLITRLSSIESQPKKVVVAVVIGVVIDCLVVVSVVIVEQE